MSKETLIHQKVETNGFPPVRPICHEAFVPASLDSTTELNRKLS